jgi:xanthine dehydrogenase large subunit
MTVGLRETHDSALLHVTGAARYVDDIPAPEGCLHLAFGLAPVARGRLVALDLAAVRAAPGVVDALAWGDLARPADTSPSVHDEPLLCDGPIHFLGQPLFLVIAESHLAARKAARLARIEVEEETPILSIDDALKWESRFGDGPVVWTKGDPEANGIGAGPNGLRGRLEIGGQEHFYLEGQAALALPGEGQMEVHSSTQHPSEIQHKVADALGLAMHDVRVVVRRMGGGFGGKESQGNALAIACAVAAERTGRACRMRYDRDDDMVVTG